MFLESNSTSPDSSLWQKAFGLALTAIGLLLAMIKRMQGKIARSTGKPVSIDEAVRAIVVSTVASAVAAAITERMRTYDQRFEDLKFQRLEDKQNLDVVLSQIRSDIQASRR